MNPHAAPIRTGLIALILSALSGVVQAQTGEGMPKPIPRIDVPVAQPELPDVTGIDSETTGAVMNEKDMLQYCVNISDSAREVRYTLIKKQLEETEAEIDRKLAELDEKLRAIKEYVEVRDKFQKAAEKQVVGIFQTMRPDAAAQQLAQLDIRLAAAIVMKLEPKTSSIILSEMRPKAAATLSSFLSAAALPEDKEREMMGQ